jgi:opacity protein-like surface antigen
LGGSFAITGATSGQAWLRDTRTVKANVGLSNFIKDGVSAGAELDTSYTWHGNEKSSEGETGLSLNMKVYVPRLLRNRTLTPYYGVVVGVSRKREFTKPEPSGDFDTTWSTAYKLGPEVGVECKLTENWSVELALTALAQTAFEGETNLDGSVTLALKYTFPKKDSAGK